MRGIGTHAPHRRHTWLAVALPACSLMIALGPDNFPLITARAFLLQGAALLLIAGILLAVCGRTWTVDGAVLSAMICIGPTFLLKNKTNSTATGSVLFTLAQMNVHRSPGLGVRTETVQEHHDRLALAAAFDVQAQAADGDELAVRVGHLLRRQKAGQRRHRDQQGDG